MAMTKNEKAAAWRLRNPEKVKASKKRYALKNPEAVIESGIKYRSKDGSKAKARERVAAWTKANPGRAEAWRKANPEKVRLSNAKNNAKRKLNPEKKRLADAKSYQVHKKKRLEKSKAYQLNNKESIRELAKRWVINNPEKVRAYRKKYNDNNRAINVACLHRRRARLINLNSTGVSSKEWREILEVFNHRCAYCLQKKPLARDHIIPISNGGLDECNNVVPACKGCNSSKGTKTLLQWTIYLGRVIFV